MAICTSEAFLKALDESRLLDPDQLAAARDAARETDDPRALAKTLVQRELLTRWQAGQLLIGRPSFFVGRYKLIDLLGKGGMGRVFLARHTMMNRPVALKMIFEHLGQDPASLEQFLVETRAIAALDHANIVHAYNVDCEGDRYYLVMEYVEGQDLQRIVEKEGPLDFEKAADYIRQAADGLAHAHGKGMIHGDIKPANLLVNQQGVIKILDLGMARLSEDEKKANGRAPPEDLLLGTVDYMAPEQAIGSSQLDHRVDIYSLGCTFYFLLTGHPPFPEGTLHERIVKHQTQEPEHILETRPDTPRELVRICEQMMAKDPAERFASAGEMSRLLGDWRRTYQRLRRAVPLTEEEVQALLTEEAAAGTGPEGTSGTSQIARLLSRVAKAGRNKPVTLGAIALGVVLVAALAAFLAGRLGSRGGGEELASSQARNEGKRILHKTALDDDEHRWPGLTSMPDKAPAGPPLVAKGPPVAAKSPAVTPKVPAPAPKKPEAAPKTSEAAPKGKPTGPDRAKPPAAVEPFKDFPAEVDLPVFAEKGAPPGAPLAPVVLASIHAGEEVPWSVAVLGGEVAMKGNRRFVLRPTGGGKSADWQVGIESPLDKEEGQGGVARFWRDKESLRFQWLEGAASAPANHLRNCVLEVSVGGQSRRLALRKPVIIEPLTVDLQRGGASQVIPLEWMPEPAHLRLDVLKVEGREGYVLQPPGPLSARTPGTLVFTRKLRQGREVPAVEFRVSLLTKRPKLLLDLKLLSPPTAQLKPLPPMARGPMEAKVKQLAKDVGAAKPDVKKFALQQELEFLERQLWYDDFIRAVHRKVRLQFRLFIDVGGQPVELARTGAARGAAEGKGLGQGAAGR